MCGYQLNNARIGDAPLIEDSNNQDSTNRQHVWITIGVGAITFVLGLFGGYVLRPMIAQEQQGTQVSAPVDNSGVIPSQPGNQEVMAYLESETRHFKGDPNAPVTMIEFSDFK